MAVSLLDVQYTEGVESCWVSQYQSTGRNILCGIQLSARLLQAHDTWHVYLSILDAVEFDVHWHAKWRRNNANHQPWCTIYSNVVFSESHWLRNPGCVLAVCKCGPWFRRYQAAKWPTVKSSGTGGLSRMAPNSALQTELLVGAMDLPLGT